MKKIFVLLLALLLCVGLAAGASAASGVSGECSWNLDENTGLLTISGSGSIIANAFRGNTDVTCVVIEEGITGIGNYAFYGCTLLESVVIKGDLSVIGNYALARCTSLTTLEYRGTTVPTAALNAFSKTSLSEVMVLPEYPDGYFCGIPASPTLDDEPIKPTYSVTVEDGTADKTAYTAGETVTITANTPAEGMRFAGWTSSDGVTFKNSSAATTTFTMPAKAVTVTATFSQIHVCGNLMPTEAKPATCIENGNTAYYTCSCGKYYLDAAAQTEIEKDSWVISDPNAHDWNEPTYTQQGEKHVAHYVCKHDNEHTKQNDPADHVYSALDYTCVCEKVQQFTITFNTDGGSTVVPITQDYGTPVTAPADPTKEGYTFAGWTPAIPSTMPAQDMTIKATWTINQYTITFDTDGGSAVAPITQDYGTPVTAPADPTKEGYTFAGWDVEIPQTMPAQDMNIKAQWTLIPLPDLPKTGDNSMMVMWSMALVLSAAGITMMTKKRKAE